MLGLEILLTETGDMLLGRIPKLQDCIGRINARLESSRQNNTCQSLFDQIARELMGSASLSRPAAAEKKYALLGIAAELIRSGDLVFTVRVVKSFERGKTL